MHNGPKVNISQLEKPLKTVLCCSPFNLKQPFISNKSGCKCSICANLITNNCLLLWFFWPPSPVFLPIKRKDQAKPFLLEPSNTDVQELRRAKSALHTKHSIVSCLTIIKRKSRTIKFFFSVSDSDIAIRKPAWAEETLNVVVYLHKATNNKLMVCTRTERVRSQALAVLFYRLCCEACRGTSHSAHTPPFFSQ